ncbi:hypothetical protein Tco_0778590, partial [Tanacetum coccineum]
MTNGNPSSVIIKQHCGRRPYALSWKPCQGDSLNLPDHRIHKDGDGDASFQLKSDSLPHAHAQSTKTFYKHQDSRIMKAQELKTKTSAQTLIYKIFLQRYQVYQGRLLASFQDDAKYEHVGQDTRSITIMHTYTGRRSPGSSLSTFGFILEVGTTKRHVTSRIDRVNCRLSEFAEINESTQEEEISLEGIEGRQ